MTRIVSWNMNQRSEGWDYLRSDLNADIALVQEAVVPPDVRAVCRQGGIASRDGGARPWGSAVVALNDDVTLTPIGLAEGQWRGRGLGVAPLDCVSRGHVAIALASVGDIEITSISAYGLMEFGYASGTLLRTLADLEPLLDSDLGANVILAGDWNIGTWWAAHDQKYADREGAILHLLEAYGFVDCIDKSVLSGRGRLENCPCSHGAACRHVETYRKAGGAYQDDYLFTTQSVLDLVKSAGPSDDWTWDKRLSDHSPLSIELR